MICIRVGIYRSQNHYKKSIKSNTNASRHVNLFRVLGIRIIHKHDDNIECAFNIQNNSAL